MLPGGLPIRREVDFRIRREDWSKYEILDGEGIVWARAILTKLYELDIGRLPRGILPPGAGLALGPQFIISTQTLVTAFFRDHKGDPTEPATPEELATGGEVLRATPLEEPWNEYLVTGPPAQILSTRCIATRIRLFRNRFNALRDPLVQVDVQVVMGPPRPAEPGELST